MSKKARHVLGLSGGKDSAALAVWMNNNYPNIRFTNNTISRTLSTLSSFISAALNSGFVIEQKHLTLIPVHPQSTI